MTQKSQFQKSNNNDDFDLDSYIEEQSHQTMETSKPTEEDNEPSFWKNAILGLALVFTAFIWYHDWSPKQAYTSIFDGNETRLATVGESENRIVVDIPEINIPDFDMSQVEQEIARISESANLPPVTDYLVELKEVGLLDDNKLSAFQARQLHDGGVPISYIQEIDNAGYLEDLSYVYITEYYKAGVTTEFLDELKDKGLYKDLSFIDVVEIFKDENN